MAQLETPQDYRKSSTFRNSDGETRRLMERYRSEQHISEEHMAWLMYLEDLRSMPKEEKQKGNRMAEGMIIGAMVLFLATLQSHDKRVLLLTSILVIVMTIIYISGVLNPYTDTLRRVKRLLKKQYPAVEPYRAWMKKQSSSAQDDSSSSSSKHSS